MISITISLIRYGGITSWSNNLGKPIEVVYTIAYSDGTEEEFTRTIAPGGNISTSSQTFTLRKNGRLIASLVNLEGYEKANLTFRVTTNNTNGSTKIIKFMSTFRHLGQFWMKNLKEVRMSEGYPSEVVDSMEGSFTGCSSLTYMLLPLDSNPVRYMNNAFEGCSRLIQWSFNPQTTNVQMDRSCYNCYELRGINHNAFDSLSAVKEAFTNCYRAGHEGNMVVNNINSLHKTFMNNENMTSLYMSGNGGTCTNMEYAFGMEDLWSYGPEHNDPYDRQMKLSSITLPSSLYSVTDMKYAFNGQTRLRTIMLPTSMPNLTNIDGTFRACNALTTLTWPNQTLSNVTTAFQTFNGCRSITSIPMPTNLSSCRDASHMFGGCEKLTSASIPNLPQVTTTQSMFRQCYNLRTVTLGSNMGNNRIASTMFWNCERLTSVNIPTNLSSLTDANAMFADAWVINNLAFPALPSLINAPSMFHETRRLSNLSLPATLPALRNGESMFYRSTGVDNVNLQAPNLETMATMFFGCENLRAVGLASVMSRLTTMSHAFSGCKKLTTVTMPTSAGNLRYVHAAFSSCESLGQVLIPANATGITGPEYLKEGGTRTGHLTSTFENCRALTRVYLPPSLPNVQSLEKLFTNCTVLVNLTGPSSFPRVNNMRYTFNGCRAFNGDLSGLQTPLINYNASNFSSITTGWDNNTNAWQPERKPRFGKPADPPPGP